MLLFASLCFADELLVDGALVRESLVQAGVQVESSVTLANPSTETIKVFLYFADAGDPERSNRPWVRFTPREVEVMPGEVTLRWKMEVPPGVLDGEVYESDLVVEKAPRNTEWPPTYSPGEYSRYSVRVVTYVD